MNPHHRDTEAPRAIGLLSEALTEGILGAAIEVHRELGPGLLESGYEERMCKERRLRGIKGCQTDGKYRIYLIVGDEVVVELKAIARLLNVHGAQLLPYLKLTGKHVGLLINVPVLHRGIVHRVL